MHLDPEQEDALSVLVEAARNLPKKRRTPFLCFHVDGEVNLIVQHGGLHGGHSLLYPGDFEVLRRANLISVQAVSTHVWEFDILPTGFAYYKNMKERSDGPIEVAESNVKKYLNGDRIGTTYPAAHQKLKNANNLLWQSDSEQQLTTIGHLCREALQEFATVLVVEHKPPNVDDDKARTISRLRAVIGSCRERLGKAKTAHLDALLVYWGTVSDLVQRQEHGDQKEGESLVWDDGSRVVFQTAMVMYEIDRTLNK